MFTSRFFALSSRPARLALLALAFASAGLAHAGEAGRIVLVHGSVQVATRTVALGDAIAEGDEIATGKDGYVYVRTVDNGLLILRPSSRARIVSYHVDKQNPANTRIKLELLSGVARSVSGDAVKLARQNFRFNTPVAAIGVRGTDFTVYTDQQTSRVTVISGGIVVSGFGGACAPEGAGPCEHSTSRELSANQVGQMLQVARGHAVPQLMTASPSLAPDAVAPPRTDEPVSKAPVPAPTPPAAPAPALSVEASLDPQKVGGILQQGAAAPKPPVTETPAVIPPAVVVPPVVVEPPVVVGPVVTLPPVSVQGPQIVWGRWQTAIDKAAVVDFVNLSTQQVPRFAQDSNFAIFRTGPAWTPPAQGAIGFSLMASEALIRDEVSGQIVAGRLENGKLNIDFGKDSFTTSFDLLSSSERFSLQSKGRLGGDGQLSGDSQFSSPTNMNVSGVVGPENGMSAAYIFSSRLDPQRIASGITFWGSNNKLQEK
jgi:hypothetical protein